MSMEIEKNDSFNDGLDLSQLMDQIRKEAEKSKRKFLENGGPPSYRQLLARGFSDLLTQGNPPLPDFTLQAPLEKRNAYQANDLLGFHDEAFIRNAYKVILKREPDDSGFARYLENLRSGRYSKIDILRSLRFSPEGQKANVSIEGLGKLTYLRKLYRVPIAGYLLQLMVAIFRLPVLIINHRRLESHTMAQFERVTSHMNEAVHHFSDASRNQAEINRKQFQAFQEQFDELRNSVR